jgi:hypothetical protein
MAQRRTGDHGKDGASTTVEGERSGRTPTSPPTVRMALRRRQLAQRLNGTKVGRRKSGAKVSRSISGPHSRHGAYSRRVAWTTLQMGHLFQQFSSNSLGSDGGEGVGRWRRAPPSTWTFTMPPRLAPAVPGGVTALIRMRSQVQVLAGPLLFSQLRALPPPGRFRSLPAWAAVGPRALRAVEPKDRPGAGDPGSRSITTSTHRGHRSGPARSWSALPAILPVATCA